MRFITGIIGLWLLGACASTTTTPVSKSEFILDTSGEAMCGRAGTAKVATRMAAVETIRSGYDGYIILNTQSQNNIQVVQTATTGATTNSTYYGYGNTTYGQSNTTFYGGSPMVLGEYSERLLVRMFMQNDEGFSNAVDARAYLGDGWPELVENGIRTCT